MKNTLFLFLFLVSVSGWAQDVIYLTPLQTAQFKPGGSVKSVLKKNQVSRDSLMMLANQKMLAGLKAKLPETDFVWADSTFLKLLSDSSGLMQMPATTNLDVINGVAGSLSTKERIKGGPVNYEGRNLTAGGVALAVEMMMKAQAKYFVSVNKLEAVTDFVIHFEIYDKNFTKIYGDKFSRPTYASGNMYFSAFKYYFDTFLTEFNQELVGKINKANTIR